MTTTTPSLDPALPAPVKVAPPTFLSPSPSPSESPSESPTPDPSLNPEAPEADSLADTAPTPSPKPPSGSSRTFSPGSAKVLRDGIAAGVAGATALAHQALARDDYDRAVGVWLADDQDIEGISSPAASMLGRRTGDLGAGNQDVADGISLAVAVVFYLVKQVQRLMTVRAMRRTGAAVDGFQPQVSPPTPTEPTTGS